MKLVLLLNLIGGLSLVQADFKCICNVNHPNVHITQCPSEQSIVYSIIYPKDANFLHGVVDTSPSTCKPIYTGVKTLPGWVAVDVNNRVGFIFKDVGLLEVVCPGNHTHSKDIFIPRNCTEAVHIISHGPTTAGQHFVPITSNPVKPTKATAHPTHMTTTTTTTKRTTTPTTTTTTPTTTTTTPTTTTTTTKPPPHFHTCRDDVIFSLALNESVEHFGAASCPDGSPKSAEAVLMEYCGVPMMSHWKQGVKVLDNCNRIPRYTPVSVYISGLMMGKPAIFHSCKAGGGIELIQQKCGSPVTLHLEQRLAAFYYVLTW